MPEVDAATRGPWAMRGLKSWTAMEGLGWQATLTHDGIPVGLVTDEGVGGGISVRWAGQEGRAWPAPEGHDAEAEARFVASSPESARALYAHVQGLPAEKPLFDGDDGRVTVSRFLAGLADWADAAVKVRRLLRTRLAFTTPDGAVKYLKGKRVPGAEVVVLKRFPGARVLNADDEADVAIVADYLAGGSA